MVSLLALAALLSSAPEPESDAIAVTAEASEPVPVTVEASSPAQTPVAAPPQAEAPAAATAQVEAPQTEPQEPAKAPKSAKPPKRSPEERLAHVDHARIEMHIGGRSYGRFLDAPAAYGGAVQLGLGVRLVRGLYLSGEATAGTHAMPITASGQVFLGLRHELRMSKWVRPSLALGYSHLIDVNYSGAIDAQCGCLRPRHEPELGFGVSARSDIDIAQRHGLEAGIGLRFPFRWAPRLSAYLRADAAYYFDQLPQRLQVSGGFGFQIVF